jgi:hypothetical protein
MKKFFWVIALVAMGLAGCASYAVWYKNDGLVPFEYFQGVKNEGERLVLISPVLAPDHRQSGLYIITNPEDIIKALDTLGDPVVLPPGDLYEALKAFSPVVIQSNNPENGIAGFSVPPFVDQFFYAYMIITQDYNWGSNDPTEVWIGTMSLPPGSQDVYIAFSEEKGDAVVSANMNPAVLKSAYAEATGLYGHLEGKKDQAGFITIGFKERVALADEKRKAGALAAGATYSVYSEYYTYQQETRSNSLYVPGVAEGFLAGASTSVYATMPHIETENYTVNIPVLHELAFEVYKGDVRVYRGTTPAKITGIEVGTEYTLRWVSPTDGNKSLRFTSGLNFLGYPADGSRSIK